MATNICKISGVVYRLTNTEDGGFELCPSVQTVNEMVQPIEHSFAGSFTGSFTGPYVPYNPNTHPNAVPYTRPHVPYNKIPDDIEELFTTMPRSIPTLITRYESLTRFEKKVLNTILRDRRRSIIDYLLEFYVYDIYPEDYHFGIKFALASLLQHPNGTVILNKIKNNIPLSRAEENILDYGGHSGCSFGGLKYWLYTIFNKMQGDGFNNYHLVFDTGECQRKHYLFLD